MSLLQEALKKLAEKKSKLLNSDEIIKSGDIDNIQTMVKDNIMSWQKIYNKSIEFDNLDVINYILKNKFITISDELIFETIKYNKYNIIDLLINENGEISDIVNKIIKMSITVNSEDIFKLMIKNYIEHINLKDFFYYVCVNGDKNQLSYLIDNYSINLLDDNSKCLSLVLSNKNGTEIFKYLIDKGANPTNSEGSFLLDAITYNNEEIVHLLIDKYNISVNIFEDAPIKRAYEIDNWDMFNLLLSKSSSSLNNPIILNKIFNYKDFIGKITKIPAFKEKLPEGTECTVGYDVIEPNQLYVKCTTCKKIFDRDILILCIKNASQLCPHCRQPWTNYKIYINK